MTQLKSKINDKINRYLRNDKIVKLLVIMGLLGIMLIAFSGLRGDEKNKTEFSQNDAKQTDIYDSETYKENIRTELEEILSDVSGVGDCSVMISVEGTSEYIYAENIDKKQNYGPQGSSDDTKTEIVIMDDSGNDKALVKKVVRPKITGVVVVCKGGENEAVKERVIKAVSAALNVSYSKICVEAKK